MIYIQNTFIISSLYLFIIPILFMYHIIYIFKLWRSPLRTPFANTFCEHFYEQGARHWRRQHPRHGVRKGVRTGALKDVRQITINELKVNHKRHKK